jgi:hypothetical protein
MFAIVTLAKDCMWCNHNNTTIKQSQTTALQGWKSCLQLTTLNLKHFKMVEIMGLKIIASKSPWMALPPYHISLNLPSSSKVISGTQTHTTHTQQTDRQTDWWYDKPSSFLESRLKIREVLKEIIRKICKDDSYCFSAEKVIIKRASLTKHALRQR